MPPDGESFFGSGMSAMAASVVRRSATALTAFSGAMRGTFTGSAMPATGRSSPSTNNPSAN